MEIIKQASLVLAGLKECEAFHQSLIVSTIRTWKATCKALSLHDQAVAYLCKLNKRDLEQKHTLSRGSAIIVILFFLLGVSAKHFREEVSTTVSQNDTTGSATFTSMSA